MDKGLKKLISTVFIGLLLFSSPVNAAVEGDNVDDVLSCGTSDDILTENGAVTISVWFKADTEGEGGSGRFVSRDNLTNGVSFGTDSQGGSNNSLRLVRRGSTFFDRETSNNVYSDATWTHALVTWDGSDTATNAHIYVNGTETGYQTSANGSSALDNSARTLMILNAETNTRTLDGMVDELALWNRVLNATEIQLLANSRLKRIPLQISSGLKRYYALDECSDGNSCSGTFVDLTGNSNCTPSNNPTGRAGVVLSY